MWFRLISAACGIWLMVAPAVFNFSGSASTNSRIIGPIIATFAVIAIWETTRELRRVNRLLGVWLLIAPFVLGYAGIAIANSLVIGVIVIAMSLQRGKVEKSFGGGWSALWQPESVSDNSHELTQDRQPSAAIRRDTNKEDY